MEFIEHLVPDPDDRRVWLVAITGAGTDLCGSISDVDRVLRDELRAGTTRAERQALADVLVRLQDNLNQPAPDPKEPS